MSGRGIARAAVLMMPALVMPVSMTSVVLAGHSGVPDEPLARAIPTAARREAGLIFAERCAVCHGTDGSGEGPAASNLNPRPANLQRREWQISVSDARIAKVIVNGGASQGLSAAMAANPDLEDKPDVVAALVERIRKFRK
jgi:mono/diheme cytochrome c family protein